MVRSSTTLHVIWSAAVSFGCSSLLGDQENTTIDCKVTLLHCNDVDLAT